MTSWPGPGNLESLACGMVARRAAEQQGLGWGVSGDFKLNTSNLAEGGSSDFPSHEPSRHPAPAALREIPLNQASVPSAHSVVTPLSKAIRASGNPLRFTGLNKQLLSTGFWQSDLPRADSEVGGHVLEGNLARISPMKRKLRRWSILRSRSSRLVA